MSWRWILGMGMLVWFAVAGGNANPSWERSVSAPKPDIRPGGDLAYYRDVIERVRHGEDYYSAANQLLAEYGFPNASPFNWRLPTYAWGFAKFRDNRYARWLLGLLSVAAVIVGYLAQRRLGSPPRLAAIVAVLLLGVVGWACMGDAFLAQEPWVAALVLISVAGFAWRRNGGCLSVGTGLAALFIRELVLPYCLIAAAFTATQRRWRDTVLWSVGIALFVLFYGWHAGQVQYHLSDSSSVTGIDLQQWIRFGGLDFVVRTTRMNLWLLHMPGWLVGLILGLSWLGLSQAHHDPGRLACLSTCAYAVFFAVAGRPENVYWGLLIAPFLPWGLAQVIQWAAGPHAELLCLSTAENGSDRQRRAISRCITGKYR